MPSKLMPLLAGAAVVAVALAWSPVGGAAADIVKHALFANNAGAVGGIRASAKPLPNRLLPLGADGKYPASVLPLTAGPQGPQGPPGARGAKGDPAMASTLTIVSHLNVAAGATASGTVRCPAGYLATGGAVEGADPVNELVTASSFVLFNGDTAQQAASGQGASAYGWRGAVRYTGTKAFESFTVAVICARGG
jgi:hypothetical protein